MAYDPSSNTLRSKAEAKVTHYSLNLAVDFKSKALVGHCDYECVPQAGEACNVLVLDTHNISVHKVLLIDPTTGAETEATHTFDEIKYATLGQSMQIPLPNIVDKATVRVKYSTSPDATALQWMTPAQTKSGKYPFLFSQCQAIHARSMLPCQDTPSNKATYRAIISAPKPLVCVMSAVSEGAKDLSSPPFEGAEGDWVQYSWFQKVPICTYLIALAVGELDSREISPRCRVWAEPAIVEECAWEFSNTEDFLRAAEDICGEYRWGRYDLLILPPSFPYGGMENPCLTFVTPTLLAGDRSLTYVVAHEVAHSWSGNLVTNQTWECFWMNEGFTVFIERKIVKRMFGEQEHGLQMEAGWAQLCDCIKRFGPSHNFTSLSPHLANGTDPDDAFSTVPYEKGCAFVCHLEALAGGEEPFGVFLKEYFDTLAYGHTDPDTLRAMYAEKFPEAADKVFWEYWLTTPGLPKEKPHYDLTRIEEAKALGQKIVAGGAIEAKDVEGWTSTAHHVLLEFLNLKAEEKHLTLEQLDRLGSEYKYDTTHNAELRMLFDLLGIKSHREKNIQDALDFATSQGRMKFTRPLMNAVKAVDYRRAHEAFLANESKWHPICAKMVKRDLEL